MFSKIFQNFNFSASINLIFKTIFLQTTRGIFRLIHAWWLCRSKKNTCIHYDKFWIYFNFISLVFISHGTKSKTSENSRFRVKLSTSCPSRIICCTNTLVWDGFCSPWTHWCHNLDFWVKISTKTQLFCFSFDFLHEKNTDGFKTNFRSYYHG